MNEPQKVKVGVVGVGKLGQYHARLYSESEKAELIGIYDVNQAITAEVAKTLSTLSFDSLEKLIKSVDCLSVAVPTHLHFEVVSELLQKKKHVLVEKPITAKIADGKKLVALAQQHKVVLQVGHVERYNPVIDYLENKINNPKFIEAHRLAFYPPLRPAMPPRGTEVSVVLDLMIHDIDVILNLVKSPVSRIDAVGIPILSKSADIANTRLTFANGCVANLTASRVSQETMRKIRVFQPDAYLSFNYQDRKGEIVTKTGMSIKREAVPIEDQNALKLELEDFLHCSKEALVQGTVPQPKVSAEHGLQALEIAVQIEQQFT